MTILKLTAEEILKRVCHGWWLGKPERGDKMTAWIYVSWYGMTDEIVVQTPWRIHFVLFPTPSHHSVRTVISHPIKQMLVL